MAGYRKEILLMTSTITPENSPELARTDPTQRLLDYADALKFYLGLIGKHLHGIVFVENSDSDVSRLRQIATESGHADHVEFLCNYGQFRYPGRDRSYGEFKLLDYAMEHSKMIADAGDDAVVWKITGRYRVVNLLSIIRNAPKKFDLYCDMRNRPVMWMDLRLMAWNRFGYRQVFEGITDKLDTEPREPVMRRYVPQRAKDAVIVPRFRNEPVVEGVRGWDNRHYFRRGARVKYLLRATARTLAPWLWI